MMVLMMRGGHGHGGGDHTDRGQEESRGEEKSLYASAEALRKRRAELDRLIAEREDAERLERERSNWVRR
jgi:hypothetical protein